MKSIFGGIFYPHCTVCERFCDECECEGNPDARKQSAATTEEK